MDFEEKAYLLPKDSARVQLSGGQTQPSSSGLPALSAGISVRDEVFPINLSCRGQEADHFQQHCPTREDPGQKQTVMDVSFLFFFLFSKENYIEMRFYL